MMNRLFTCACLLALAGCSVAIRDFRGGFDGFGGTDAAPVAPEPIAAPQSAKQRFIDATAANGCQVNSTNSAIILDGATLSREDLARVMTEIKAEGGGRIADDGTSFLLTSGACA